jgi:hypothetical protein
MNPKFPLYIVSKGRWESRMTTTALHAMGVPHYIVVEAQEREKYAAVVSDSATLLTLDPKYQEDYDPCDDLGTSRSKGSGAARNFAWEHSIANGHDWHWVMDDNIRAFARLNNNIKINVMSGAFFAAMEDFCLRYKNVAMAGPNYDYFAPRKAKKKPFTPNTRIYSCNLIRNDMPYRWAGRYNEDTHLSLRMLKSGWCTILFNAFLQRKTTTLTMKGGNTDDVYKDGTVAKSQMIARLHPDVTKVTWKFGRVHHHTTYSGFRQRLQRIKEPTGGKVNNYGMELKQNEQWAAMSTHLS